MHPLPQGDERSAFEALGHNHALPHASRASRCNRWSCAGALPPRSSSVSDCWLFRLCKGSGRTANSKPRSRLLKDQVYQIADTQHSAVNSGAKLQQGEKVRTAKDGRAVVRLGDGSLIEMKDRSELYLTKSSNGTTIHLNRGSIVVEAAKQKDGQLFVESGDSLVSVTGTVFSVNNGTKGSRVSVIEGEVKLNHASSDRVLRPGDQATTNPAIAMIPVKDEVSWSRNAERYAAVLNGLASLKNELKKIEQPGVRNSTHLLDLMPEGTVVYAALPNLADSIVESHRVIQERMSQNPALRQWWEKEQSGRAQNMDQVVETIRQFGSYLGDEIAVSVSMDDKGNR